MKKKKKKMQDYSKNNETRNKVLKMRFTYLNHFCRRAIFYWCNMQQMYV